MWSYIYIKKKLVKLHFFKIYCAIELEQKHQPGDDLRDKRHINTKAKALWRPLASFPCLWTEVKHTLSSVIVALHSSEVCIEHLP